MHPQDSRRAGRLKTRFESLISASEGEGAGMLVDISFSGARVVEASVTPEVGKQLRMYVFVHPVAPFELVGTVVRQDLEGFAIEFETLSDEVRQLVSEAEAMIAGAEPTGWS